MATPNIVPRADSEGGLGTASKYWASAYIDTINATVIQSPTTDGDLILKADNGSGAMTAYLTLDGGASKIIVGKQLEIQGDNRKLTIGASGDLEIYHDGSNSYIKNAGTGNLKIMGNNLYLQNTSGGSYIDGINGDRVEIKFNNSTKLTTTNTGIDVTGTVNGIPFFSDVANNSMYTHDVSGTDDTAQFNTAYGFAAMDAITTGDSNVAVGYNAGSALTSGIKNILIGKDAGDSLTEGNFNIVIGTDALQTEDTHGKNIAIGHAALELLNAGADAYNVAVGFNSGKTISTGIRNVLIGGLAGDALTTGSSNIAIGHQALSTEDAHGLNIAIGHNALASQNVGADAYNVAIGHFAG